MTKKILSVRVTFCTHLFVHFLYCRKACFGPCLHLPPRNLSIYNILRWDDGTNELSTKSLMFQVFFTLFIDLGHSKLFIFIFVILYKKIRKWIERISEKRFAKNLEKKYYLERQTLGQQFNCPIVQVTKPNIL